MQRAIEYILAVAEEGSMLPAVYQSKGTYTIDENGYYIKVNSSIGKGTKSARHGVQK